MDHARDRRFAPYHQHHHHSPPPPPPRKAPRNLEEPPWRLEEDELLRSAVYKHGGKKWKTISTLFDKRSPAQCNARWSELQNHGTAVKKPWSPAEDSHMLELVRSHGAGKWAVIASYLPGRNGKQCRERWHNQLNPAIKKSPWTSEEDEIIMEMQAKYGNRWAKITEKLPGRTDNAVKNHWHSSMKAKLKRPSSSSPTATSGTMASAGYESSSDSSAVSGVPRRRSSKKISASRGSQRGSQSAQGSSSPDCVSAIAYEVNPLSPSYEDFASFALHDPVAPELFDLPRHVFEDVTDPVGFMRDYVIPNQVVSIPHEIPNDEFEVVQRDVDDCCMDMSGSFHFEEMLRSCVSPEPFVDTVSPSTNAEADFPPTHVPMDNSLYGEAASSTYPATAFVPCSETQATLEELCAPPPDILALCSVKSEMAMLEPLYNAQEMVAVMAPCEMACPAPAGWDHFSPEMHWSVEMPMPHPIFQYDCDISMANGATGDASDGALEMQTEPAFKTETEADARGDVALGAALDCLQDDYDALVGHLSV